MRTDSEEQVKNKIQKSYNVINNLSNSSEFFELRVGDIFINDRNEYYPIVQINNIFSKLDDDGKEEVIVEYKFSRDYKGKSWEERSYNLPYFTDSIIKGYAKLDLGKSIEEYFDEANKLINGEIDIAQYSDNADIDTDNEKSLISRSSKDSLIKIQKDLEERKNKAELIRKFVGLEMLSRKKELEKIRENLNGILDVFKKKINKIMNLIKTI